MPMRRIVLCADDYGLSEGVSRGIRELLSLGRLSATSCMVDYPEFERDGPLLRPWFDRVDIGLHFALTANQSVTALMRQAYLGRLDTGAVAAELERQLAAFVAVMGRPPDYIDGHQHVHLLPGVREPVVCAARRLGIYVRSTREPINAAMIGRPSPVEAVFLSWTCRPLQRLVCESEVATNRGFRGVRTFREMAPYATLFRRMIAGVQGGSLVMCHPGVADETLGRRDAVTTARENELRYFESDAFVRDLADNGLSLSRLAGIDAAAPELALSS